MKLPATAQNIIDTLKKPGFEAYAVGGSVRDTIMKKPTAGWDFTTNAEPEEIIKLFSDSFYDNNFGTVGIKIKDNQGDTVDIYEITTYRSEDGYSDRRHPDTVTWGKTLKDDLSRRDFTINAIATDGTDIIDPYGGRQDIDNKIIKTVGDPTLRFEEDALRMMRAVRIAAQLGFSIEPETIRAINVSASLLKHISPERIRDEFMKILSSEYPADGILILKNSGLLDLIVPEMSDTFGVGQISEKRHHIYDVGTHSVQALKHCPSKNPITRLATLLHDIGKAKTRQVTTEGVVTFYNHEIVSARLVKEISRRLKLSKKDSQLLYTLVRWHQFSVDERQTDSAIRRIIKHIGKENLEEMLALRTGDRLGGGARETSWRLELFKKRLEEVQKQPFTVADLKVNGYDVMKIFACKPGPVIGKILEHLFSQVENNILPNERETLLNKLEELKENDVIFSAAA